MMIRSTVRRAIRATHPPHVDRIVHAFDLRPSTPPSIVIAIGSSLAATLDRLEVTVETSPGQRTLLIPDQRRRGRPGPRAALAVATWLAGWTAVTIGLPAVTPEMDVRGWRSLAERAGATVISLGTNGWDRVEFGDRSQTLVHADVPAELHSSADVVTLSAPAGDGSLALWSGVVHPNSQLRSRLAPNAVVELSAAVDARYLLVGQVGTFWIATWATRAIAAELVARAIERLRQLEVGVEAEGPWEDAGVQHLMSIDPEAPLVAGLVLRARLEDNTATTIARRISEQLGWRLELGDDIGAGGIR